MALLAVLNTSVIFVKVTDLNAMEKAGICNEENKILFFSCFERGFCRSSTNEDLKGLKSEQKVLHS